MSDTQHNFLIALAVLRQCGFFEEYQALPIAQAAEALLQRLRLVRADDPWYVAHPEYRPEAKLLAAFSRPADAKLYKEIAGWDFTRVWAGDMEADAFAGNNVYAQLVEEYARLSMGTLTPTAITEIWASKEGPITLSFNSQGQHFTTKLTSYNDWLDEDFFTFLDEAMRSQGFTATIYAEVNTSQDVFLVRATEQEKNSMEQLLGWSFNWQALISDSAEETA